MKAKPELAWCWKWDDPNIQTFLIPGITQATRKEVLERVANVFPIKANETRKTWRQRTRRMGIKVVRVEVREK